MQSENNKKYIWGAIIVVAIILVVGFISISKNSTAPGKYDNFAKCVANKGLTMYGAVWCSHCTNEKKAFGESFKYIKYVECPDDIKLCTDLGINGYPTWIDGTGKKYEGEQGLTGLAQITGCLLPNTAL